MSPSSGPTAGEEVEDAARALAISLSHEHREKLAAYAELVLRWNRFANLTGAPDAPSFVRKFIADALAIAPFVQGERVADLGSGAGLPGVVLAILAPARQAVLVEARARRARFLRQVSIELGLENVEVVGTRIEDWRPRHLPDTIVCQAVGSLRLILGLTAHLHSPATRVLALKGQAPAEELRELGASAAACSVHPLQVPGWQARHLVTIDCGRLLASS